MSTSKDEISYKKTKELILQNPNFNYFEGQKAEALLQKAEKFLNIHISGTYRKFLLEFGAGSFASFELLGLTNDNFMADVHPDGIGQTYAFRKQIDLPNHLLTIHHFGNGEVFCLDLSVTPTPSVVAIWPSAGEPVAITETIAASFGEFFLEYVTRALSFEKED